MTLYLIKNTDSTCRIMRVLEGTVEGEIKKWFQPDTENGETMDDFSLERVGVAEYREIQESDLPQSKNYRNAWVDTGKVDIDLERAKPLQRGLMIQKMYERIEPDEFGERDLSETIAEIKAIDVSKAKNIDELYNLWPASIERRSGDRKYKIKRT